MAEKDLFRTETLSDAGVQFHTLGYPALAGTGLGANGLWPPEKIFLTGANQYRIEAILIPFRPNGSAIGLPGSVSSWCQAWETGPSCAFWRFSGLPKGSLPLDSGTYAKPAWPETSLSMRSPQSSFSETRKRNGGTLEARISG